MRITNSLPDDATEVTGDIEGIQPIADAFGTEQTIKELREKIKDQDAAYAVFVPRGLEKGSDLNDTQLRRRYMLIGQTLDGMRVWDIACAVKALHSMDGDAPLSVQAEQGMAVNALYASLFVHGISGLQLYQVPSNQKEGPDYLNVLKVMDIPEAAVMAAERCPLQIQSDETNGWEFLRAMAASPVAKLKVEWVE